MRRRVADREVVDADQAYALVDEATRGRQSDPNEPLVEALSLPELRVPGLEQHPFNAVWHRVRTDLIVRTRRVHDHTRTQEHLDRERVDAGSLVDEMKRCVDVRARVDSEVDTGEVYDVAVLDRR